MFPSTKIRSVCHVIPLSRYRAIAQVVPRSSTFSTQYEALNQIIILSGEDLVIRDALERSGAGIFLHTFPKLMTSRRRVFSDLEPDVLLATSRKALICVEENEINHIAKEIASFRSSESNYVVGEPTMLKLLIQLFTLAQRYAQFSLLALPFADIGTW